MDKSQLKYLPSHEWAAIEGKIATVGITSYAVEQLTDVTHLQLPAIGKAVTAGKAFGEIESVKAVFDLNSPVTGTVAEVNKAVQQDPSLINSDSYGVGWMVKIEMAPGATTDHLLDLAAYEKQLAESH
ncbi:glycine cleavage system protein GcvH [Zavarzinella formosa]|uniref:glycine cleavage system protein GcvH n=1 Tax=Zavarzinella formosa TaxID=360055 RepID=UPI00031981C7|nr:glycine cleavage system protein GcvH [Zavarzinella formosa]